jgi:hypothetical protein
MLLYLNQYGEHSVDGWGIMLQAGRSLLSLDEVIGLFQFT